MIKFFAERQCLSNRIALHMADQSQAGTWLAQPLAMVKRDDPGVFTQPFITLDQAAAQQLMDELWHCGLRPSEGSGSAGQLAATQRHLDDMKVLAFHALKVPKNG